ncbi:hypothetical protein N7474_003875 [Penicillium riverlandense]|uniref:uncharacterized protein n=1 Tax=Penicillium riverlandense TaxID=1903569 RepID=UPI002547F91D|nr:uncharacterized protein N7474_003875 [Penicillium riverlandense]KAJ5818284.1 hypothetical protein N7474_003875 [Penicillium riverlandense]
MPSFFNRPSWASKQTGGANPEFYRRSGQTYSDIVAANREAHEKHHESSVDDGRGHKRLRLSDAAEEERSPEDSGADGADSAQHESGDLPEPSSRSPSHPQNKRRTASPEIIDSDGERAPPDSPESDLRAADAPQVDRLRALQSHDDSPARSTTSLESASDAHDTMNKDVQRPLDTTITSPHPPPPLIKPEPAAKPEPNVQILISSDIINTKPLLVHRKMSQGLREVRLAWCKRQNFTEDMQSSVYLTWKGRRLFDVTTCKSLGLNMDSSTIPEMDDELSSSPAELKIHMKAVSDTLPTASPSASSPDAGTGKKSPPGDEADEQAQPIRIVLRSPGMNDFRIKARLKTPVSRLISAFRDKHDIPSDADVALVFDGDRLDPDTCLQDYDIDDLDLVDVQIKTQ